MPPSSSGFSSRPAERKTRRSSPLTFSALPRDRHGTRTSSTNRITGHIGKFRHKGNDKGDRPADDAVLAVLHSQRPATAVRFRHIHRPYQSVAIALLPEVKVEVEAAGPLFGLRPVVDVHTVGTCRLRPVWKPESFDLVASHRPSCSRTRPCGGV